MGAPDWSDWATHVSRRGASRIATRHVQRRERVDARACGLPSYGVAKLGIQLAHAGRGLCASPSRAASRWPRTRTRGQQSPVCFAPFAPGWHTPVVTRDSLREVKEQFVNATRRAARMGFDLVELHAGHGYLLHEFLSPLANHRDDEYGGSTHNRIRFPLEVFEAVRAAWPADRPLGVRVSATDWVEGGWTPEETVVLARELKALGCDFMDVTSGQVDPRQKIPFAPGYNVPFAEKVKKESGIAVMAVGMVTRPHQAEELVAAGRADLVAIARAMMDDPRWAWHAARELSAETAYAPNYVRCSPSQWKP